MFSLQNRHRSINTKAQFQNCSYFAQFYVFDKFCLVNGSLIAFSCFVVGSFVGAKIRHECKMHLKIMKQVISECNWCFRKISSIDCIKTITPNAVRAWTQIEVWGKLGKLLLQFYRSLSNSFVCTIFVQIFLFNWLLRAEDARQVGRTFHSLSILFNRACSGA